MLLLQHFHLYNLASLKVILISINGNCIFPVLPSKNLRVIFLSTLPQSDSKFFRLLQNVPKVRQLLASSLVSIMVQATIISSLDDLRGPLTLLPLSLTALLHIAWPCSKTFHQAMTLFCSQSSEYSEWPSKCCMIYPRHTHRGSHTHHHLLP